MDTEHANDVFTTHTSVLVSVPSNAMSIPESNGSTHKLQRWAVHATPRAAAAQLYYCRWLRGLLEEPRTVRDFCRGVLRAGRVSDGRTGALHLDRPYGHCNHIRAAALVTLSPHNAHLCGGRAQRRQVRQGGDRTHSGEESEQRDLHDSEDLEALLKLQATALRWGAHRGWGVWAPRKLGSS